MSYLLLFLYLIVLCFIIYKAKFFYSPNLNKHWVIGIFISKFVAGLLLYAVYAFLYEGRATGDIFKYFDDGNIIFSALMENPLDYFKMVSGIGGNAAHLIKYYDTCNFWLKDFNYGLINDNRIVIRFNAIVRIFSLGNIHIHTLFLSFLSFTGLWAIFKVFEQSLKIKIVWLIGAIFFFPSVFFWTSGLLKEGLLTFAFGVLFYHSSILITKKLTLKTSLVILFSIFILLLSKFYVLVAALPGLLFLFINKKLRINLFVTFIIAHGIFLLLAWFSEPIIGLSFPDILAKKQHDFIAYSESLSKVGSLVELEPIEPKLISIIKNTPTALYNSIARPTLLEVNNSFMLMAALENTLILMFLLLTIIFFNKRYLKEPLLWFSISFTIILFTLIGLTTPVLGALVRYKTPALPFLGIIFIYFINHTRIRYIINKITIWQK